MKHLAIIRFWYEGNAFSPVSATRELFENREWLSGETAAQYYRHTNLEPGAVDEFLKNYNDIAAHYIFCTAAYPAGPMAEGLFDEIVHQVRAGLSAENWSGIYLSLHGSAVAVDQPQPELALLKQVRETVGKHIPVAVSFDLHANLDPQLAKLADIICGYKTYPHIDMLETGARALDLLGKTINAEITPVSIIVSAGFAPGSFNMTTDRGPMADMQSLAGQVEKENGFYDVSVFGGFVYADRIDTGAAISICADASVLDQANRLARLFRYKAALFDRILPNAASTLVEMTNLVDREKCNGPIAVLEPSDNIFSGGGGDTPGLLRTVIDANIHFPCLFAFFWDPYLVQAATQTGIGNEIQCRIGARLTTAFGPPVSIDAQVTRLTDGRFTNLGPMEKNLEVDLGATAVLKAGQISIVITSRNIPVNDRAWFDLHDVDPKDFGMVFVKGKNHFRSAFENVFSRIVSVETPGPAASDIRGFSFKNLPAERLNFALNIRHARNDDAHAIAAIHTSSWREVYRNILPREYLSDQIEQERNRFWTEKLKALPTGEMVMTICSGDVVIGFIWTEDGDEPGYDTVIHAFHVESSVRGCGYGKQLLKAVVSQLMEKGVKSVCLRVFDDNHAAIRIYEKLGGIRDQGGVDNFAGANAPDSRIGWRDIKSLAVRL